MSNSIWTTLSQINVNEHVKTKGGYSYLAWTWAWATVKEHYPQARYQLLDDIIYPDGTMEVRVDVVITSANDAPLSNTMWLPVLDHKNKAIANPNAFDINSARMRCLVKCLAMFGLGHYIYAGESTPQEPAVTFTPEQKAQYTMLLANEDGWGLKKFGNEVGIEVMNQLFNSSPQGQKTAVKAKCRELVQAANNQLKTAVAAIQEALDFPAGDEPSVAISALEEIYAEMGEVESEFVSAALNEVEIQKIQILRSAA